MKDNSGVRRIAGFNQFAKLARKGRVKKVYLANDADIFYVNGVRNELSSDKSIEIVTDYNSQQLAEMAGVEVPTAVVSEVLD